MFNFLFTAIRKIVGKIIDSYQFPISKKKKENNVGFSNFALIKMNWRVII